MKKSNNLKLSLLLTIAASMIIQACVKDTVETTRRYTIYKPIYKTFQEVRANIKTATPVKIQQPGKLYLKDNFIFLTEQNKGIHIIDNTNPSSPQNTGFLEIPMNADIAMKNNSLYADMASDLLTIDVSNPKNASLKKVDEKVFYSYWGDKILTGYETKDTIIRIKGSVGENYPTGGPGYYLDGAFYNSATSGSTSGATGAAGPSYGTGGSLARFAATHEKLYAVGFNSLSVFNITQDNNPSFLSKKDIGWGIETIFPYKNNLFVGSQIGVKIFSLANPESPSLVGEFGHVRKCDPVVANDKYAFVTLRVGTTCGGNNSELQILSIESLTNPTLIKSYPLENPYGLSIDGNTLFVCDGIAGLKIYDVSDLLNIKLIKQIKDIIPYDVIASNGLAIVVGSSGLYQFDYKNLANIKLLSTTEIHR